LPAGSPFPHIKKNVAPQKNTVPRERQSFFEAQKKKKRGNSTNSQGKSTNTQGKKESLVGRLDKITGTVPKKRWGEPFIQNIETEKA